MKKSMTTFLLFFIFTISHSYAQYEIQGAINASIGEEHEYKYLGFAPAKLYIDPGVATFTRITSGIKVIWTKEGKHKVALRIGSMEVYNISVTVAGGLNKIYGPTTPTLGVASDYAYVGNTSSGTIKINPANSGLIVERNKSSIKILWNKTGPKTVELWYGTMKIHSLLVNVLEAGIYGSTQSKIGKETEYRYKNGTVGIIKVNPESAGIVTKTSTGAKVFWKSVGKHKVELLGFYDTYTVPVNVTHGIWEYNKDKVSYYGKVGIGTTNPDAELTVKGKIHSTSLDIDGMTHCEEILVDTNVASVPDYVFEQDYKLLSLEEIKAYIKTNKHLPEVPSAKEMAKSGIKIKEMNLLLLKKIEELTLYVIKLQEDIKELKK